MSVDADGLLAAKPKTGKGKRFLAKRAPKVHENPKTAIFLRGHHTDDQVKELLLDLFTMKKPLAIHFTKRNQKTHPFEDARDLEYLCQKNDSSLFAFGSKSKKRPFRLILGRTFDGTVLDMQEFSVENYKARGAKEFKGKGTPSLGSKPLVLFQGAGFDTDTELRSCKNMLLDFFRGPTVDEVELPAIDHVIAFSVLDPPPGAQPTKKSILMRHYLVQLKKSGTKIPRVALEEIGPSCGLNLDRTKPADSAMMKAALKVPKELKVKKVKNVTTDSTGTKRGRLHLEQQDFTKLHTPHAHAAGKHTKEGEEGPKKKRKTE